ncbi:hypothetical protein [Aquimarina sediminis]|uniref:hypothetical protein n=1 Tax=Aquimarina sediminis TaxID=2070536 RepID=UPI000CA0047D|nr:hypothetical protein [Aquimarina sediminis]
MKRPQSKSVIFTLVILAGILTGFKTEPLLEQNSNTEFIEVIDLQKDYGGLIGTWVKQDNPEISFEFKTDFTVIEKTKEKTAENKWSIKTMDREVCIGTAECIYFEATETSLFLYVNDEILMYDRVRKE